MYSISFYVFKWDYGYNSQEQEWGFMKAVIDPPIDELLMAGEPSLGWTLEQNQR